MPRIALDTMGSELPDADIEGALMVVTEQRLKERELNGKMRGEIERRRIEIILIGDRERILKTLGGRETGLPLRIEHEPERLTMDDLGFSMIRRTKKGQHSIGRGIDMLRAGEADAFVSAGNTGAVVAASRFRLGMLTGVKNPALAVHLPTSVPDAWALMLDAGATSDPSPADLRKFAHMGTVYVAQTRGVQMPTFGVLSNGEEEGKGNESVKELSKALKDDPSLPGRYVGNVEPKHILENAADVVVTDGFTGNIALKSLEAAAKFSSQETKREIMRSSWFWQLVGAGMRWKLRDLKKRHDPDTQGAAPLLGVDGLVYIGHGHSSPEAIRSALVKASEGVEKRVAETLKERCSSDKDAA